MFGRKEILDVGWLVLITAVLSGAHYGLRDAPPPPLTEEAACTLEPVEEGVEQISVARARELLGQPGVTFVDARTADRFEAAHVPGAVNLPAGGAAEILGVQSVPIPPTDLVVTYCEQVACGDSEYLGRLLEEQVGCEQVRVLEGGWDAWLEAGGPVKGTEL